MNLGKGQVAELILKDGCRYVRVSCPPNLIPSPGQYLLASDGSDATRSSTAISKSSSLPLPLFYTDSAPQGFIAEAPAAAAWSPGLELYLRGPLGHGFTLPYSARKVGLFSLEDKPGRLKGLIRPALRQEAAIALVSNSVLDDLPDEVEVQPLSALHEILEWADYLAFDVARGNLPQLKERLGRANQLVAGMEAQVLVYTPIPCGGIAECGICAVTLKSGWKLACKDGPVFDWREI